ncbi:MAG: hypothetical protein GAK29_03782 [Acinetobacter bereziniae]|uniref:Uncharacterized protein n=1 Tax=Acinetobacter bereziniae TaxID=106648 RepID=A0A833PCY9_ACIBZ|nr:MAG: hypothetical protein GAK29_03782 [Acinetobacter bereziniae]
MDNLVGNFILSISTGMISGVIAGIYTGIISSKYAAIEEIKREILRIIRDIDYVDGKYLRGHEMEKINIIFLASSELLGMNQRKAGLVVRQNTNKLIEDIDNTKKGNSLNTQILMDFQREVRQLPISKRYLLKIW